VVARAGGVDAESALRGWAATYRRRFEAMEHLALERDLDLAALDPGGVAALWLEAAAAPTLRSEHVSIRGALTPPIDT
jgi:tetrapyrrole methylase family protein/MazG family protein